MSGCEEDRKLLCDDDQGSSPTATASSSSALPLPDFTKARVDCSLARDEGPWLDLTLAPASDLSPSTYSQPTSIATATVSSTVKDRILPPSYGFFQPSGAVMRADQQSPCSLPNRREEWAASDNQVKLREHERRDTESSTEPRVFGCQFCTRKFYSSQALGGHQNAHKRERSAGRKGPKLPSPFLPVQSRFPGMLLRGDPPSPGSLDSCNNSSVNLARSLGIKAHSLIHKPSSFRLDTPYKGPSLPQAHSGWSPLTGQQPGVGRCEMVSISSSRPTLLGVGKFESSFGFGGGRFVSLFPEDDGSSFTWQSPNHSSCATDGTNRSRMGPNFSSAHHHHLHHHHHHQHTEQQQSSKSVVHSGINAGAVTMAEAPQGNHGAQEGPGSVDLSLRL